MTAKETGIFNRLPKKVKPHVVSVEISNSGDYNDRGQELKNYTITWDDDSTTTFQNIKYMLWALKEYGTDDGYYLGA